MIVPLVQDYQNWKYEINVHALSEIGYQFVTIIMVCTKLQLLYKFGSRIKEKKNLYLKFNNIRQEIKQSYELWNVCFKSS